MGNSQLIDYSDDAAEEHDPIGGRCDGTFDLIPTWAGRALVGAALLVLSCAAGVIAWHAA